MDLDERFFIFQKLNEKIDPFPNSRRFGRSLRNEASEVFFRAGQGWGGPANRSFLEGMQRGLLTRFLKKADEKVDALSDLGGFEKALAVVGVVDELLGDGVRAGGGVAGFIQGGIHLFVDLGREAGEGPVDGAAKSIEGFFFFMGREGGVENRADAGVGVGFFIVPFFKVNTEDSVEEEVGRAFFGFAGGPDEANGPDGGGAAFRVVAVIAEEVADAEHTVTFQGFFKHLPVAGLEDVEGHPTVREEDGVGQEHDAALFGDFERVHLIGVGGWMAGGSPSDWLLAFWREPSARLLELSANR